MDKLDGIVDDTSMSSLMCPFNRGNIEETNFEVCVCTFLFCVCVGVVF